MENDELEGTRRNEALLKVTSVLGGSSIFLKVYYQLDIDGIMKYNLHSTLCYEQNLITSRRPALLNKGHG